MNNSASDTHFDAIVIGSGFGGSVTAYRLAEAGLSVCVLERGKPYPPNSFPRSPHRMKNNFWDPSEGLYGMYNIWSFSGLGAVVCSGLGGGSLIYANVMIRKDERWFVKENLKAGGLEYWPVTRKDLDPHYDRSGTRSIGSRTTRRARHRSSRAQPKGWGWIGICLS
jgi:cholesterol oxidase